MNISSHAFLHGNCPKSEAEVSFTKAYPKVSLKSNNGILDAGLSIEKGDIVVERRQCGDCPGCYIIGGLKWFRDPSQKPIEVYWSREIKWLRDLVDRQTELLDPKNPYYVSHCRTVYNLQRVVLRCAFEEIKRAGKVLPEEILSVVLTECYLKSSEDWVKPSLTVAEAESQQDRIKRRVVDDVKRNTELCQLLFEVVGQTKFFAVDKKVEGDSAYEDDKE